MPLSDSSLNVTLDRAPHRPRFHLIYYVLAAFDLLAVSLGLYLIDRISSIHADAIAQNQVWAARLADLAEIAQLGAGVNTPGNDVFQSGDVEGQLRKLEDAVHDFDAAIDAFREDLRANVDPAEAAAILARLEEADGNMATVVVEAMHVFDAFSAQSTETAGRAMATMDQAFARALHSLAAAEVGS